jgi:hypothetical protein
MIEQIVGAISKTIPDLKLARTISHILPRLSGVLTSVTQKITTILDMPVACIVSSSECYLEIYTSWLQKLVLAIFTGLVCGSSKRFQQWLAYREVAIQWRIKR